MNIDQPEQKMGPIYPISDISEFHCTQDRLHVYRNVGRRLLIFKANFLNSTRCLRRHVFKNLVIIQDFHSEVSVRQVHS